MKLGETSFSKSNKSNVKSLKGATLYESSIEDRNQKRQDFRAENFELDSSKNYLKRMTFGVPLDTLYTLVKTCQNNKNSVFAPIILEIKS